jgi:heme/copper-type cytochrome/quinol oxidase subunit 2
VTWTMTAITLGVLVWMGLDLWKLVRRTLNEQSGGPTDADDVPRVQ